LAKQRIGRTSISASVSAAVELAANGPVAAPDAAALIAKSNRAGLAEQLRSFGEDSVASAVEAASDETIWRISKRGVEIAFSGENIPRSLCLASVEIIEGKPRALARRRRRRAT
jgi:hypothetical protein